MVSHLRRSFGLLLLLALGAGCYDATFYDYPGKDAGSPDTRAKADVRDSSQALDTKASPDTAKSPDAKKQ
jgi:hypothetical protein